MPGGGSKPGERRGGKRKGSKNKATIERELMAAQSAERTVTDARAVGKKLAKEVLEEFMFLFAGMAAHHQPAPPNTAENPNEDPDQFDKYAVLAVDCAKKLAPYQSPTFQAIMIAPPPPDPNDASNRKRITLTIFEGPRPVRMIEQKPVRPTNGRGTS